jgi:hypothetical protein
MPYAHSSDRPRRQWSLRAFSQDFFFGFQMVSGQFHRLFAETEAT